MKVADGAQAGAGVGVARAAPTSSRPASAETVIEKIKQSLGEAWPPLIYRERILRMRTRSYHLRLPPPGAAAPRVKIEHTLLGIELKVGRHRMLCPDLATARYLAVFARAGCADVAVPYDISQISRVADDLEAAWHRMLVLVDHLAEGRTSRFRLRVRSKAVGSVRQEIGQAGAGRAVPEFNQNTKQRVRRV